MVKERIRSVHQDLPPNQKLLAEFILNHLEEISFWSIHNLASQAGTSSASVVRFAQRLGYAGYPALREDIVNILKTEINRDHVSRIETLEGDVLSRVANQDVQDINDTLKQINRSDFNAAVDFILVAKRVYTAGLGISNLMSEILAYQLNQVGIAASPLRSGPSSFLEQLAFFDKDDLLIAFSYPPYSEETIKLAKLSRKKGLKVLAITNKPAAPVSFHSDVVLSVKSENVLFTNAFAAISVIINALATECAHRDKTKAQSMLSHFQTINGISDEQNT
ncbi:MAG: MurR/RpiR family transcriptional regulator [Candidatus Marinimicrobia bacterium]|nr:MurR/RpiR family transcriptional regulator [Candidatus Neomarinimicrobiota bacterium]